MNVIGSPTKLNSSSFERSEDKIALNPERFWMVELITHLVNSFPIQFFRLDCQIKVTGESIQGRCCYGMTHSANFILTET